MDLPELKAVDSLTTEEVLSALKTLRTVPLRRSALTCALAQRALRASGLGNEKWVIVEQLAIAALDTGDIKVAESCISDLVKHFGDETKRVSRLKGMLLEAEGRFGEADVLYAGLLERFPTDKLTVWRKVACSKAQGKVEDAVKEIEAHLQVVHAEEAYVELVNLHTNKTNPDYERAQTACEELLLHDPTVFAYHLIYAELLSSSGKSKGCHTLARKYFSESVLQFGAPNTRALWGIWQTCITLKSEFTLTLPEQEENTEMFKWVKERLVSIYEKVDSKHARTSLALLEAN